MKLPHLLTDDKSAHLVLLLLGTTNLLLIVILFFLLVPSTRQILPRLLPVTEKTPVVRFSLVSPKPNSTISGTTALITTLSNGPKIVKAELKIDSQKVQTVFTQKTEKLTLFWDTTKQADGSHQAQITIIDDKNLLSNLSATYTVKNNVSRNVGER